MSDFMPDQPQNTLRLQLSVRHTLRNIVSCVNQNITVIGTGNHRILRRIVYRFHAQPSLITFCYCLCNICQIRRKGCGTEQFLIRNLDTSALIFAAFPYVMFAFLFFHSFPNSLDNNTPTDTP